jgi:hypothetical protein
MYPPVNTTGPLGPKRKPKSPLVWLHMLWLLLACFACCCGCFDILVTNEILRFSGCTSTLEGLPEMEHCLLLAIARDITSLGYCVTSHAGQARRIGLLSYVMRLPVVYRYDTTCRNHSSSALYTFLHQRNRTCDRRRA